MYVPRMSKVAPKLKIRGWLQWAADTLAHSQCNCSMVPEMYSIGVAASIKQDVQTMNWFVVLHYRKSLSFLPAICFHFHRYVTCIQSSQANNLLNNVLMWSLSICKHQSCVPITTIWHNSTSFIYKKLSKLKINVLHVIWSDLPFLIKYSVITFAFFTARTRMPHQLSTILLNNKYRVQTVFFLLLQFLNPGPHKYPATSYQSWFGVTNSCERKRIEYQSLFWRSFMQGAWSTKTPAKCKSIVSFNLN